MLGKDRIRSTNQLIKQRDSLHLESNSLSKRWSNLGEIGLYCSEQNPWQLYLSVQKGIGI